MSLADILNTSLTDLFGFRKPAPARPVVGPKPRMGATLCCAGLRMTVQAGLTDEMWQGSARSAGANCAAAKTACITARCPPRW